MKQAFFVTGTDTEVGKTVVSCALLQRAKQLQLSTGALKPVAAGATADGAIWRNEDAVALMSAMTLDLPYEQVNPGLLKAAVAPHIAAEEEGRRLQVSRLAGFCRGAMLQKADLWIVEGAGGWQVPLNSRECLSDLARELQLPVILVVGLKLGCINHALLTVQAIQATGLPLAGWVANAIDPDMQRRDSNIATLRARIPAPCLGELPFQAPLALPALAECLRLPSELMVRKPVAE